MPLKDSTCILFMARDCWASIGGVIQAFVHSAGDPNLICFGICVDEDDARTQEAVQKLIDTGLYKIALFVHEGGRPKFWGTCINRMARHPLLECEWYHIVNDDNYPLEWKWDQHCAAMAREYPDDDMFAWCAEPSVVDKESGLPMYAADYLMISHRWLRDAGELFPERYPFWFMDFSLGMVHRMVTGRLIRSLHRCNDRGPLQLLARKVSPTKRFRDYEFWRDYFVALEPERVALARKICRARGIEGAITHKIRAQLWEETRAVLFNDEAMAGRIERLSDPSPPDAKYLEAKAEAEAHMARLRAEAA